MISIPAWFLKKPIDSLLKKIYKSASRKKRMYDIKTDSEENEADVSEDGKVFIGDINQSSSDDSKEQGLKVEKKVHEVLVTDEEGKILDSQINSEVKRKQQENIYKVTKLENGETKIVNGNAEFIDVVKIYSYLPAETKKYLFDTKIPNFLF